MQKNTLRGILLCTLALLGSACDLWATLDVRGSQRLCTMDKTGDCYAQPTDT